MLGKHFYPVVSLGCISNISISLFDILEKLGLSNKNKFGLRICTGCGAPGRLSWFTIRLDFGSGHDLMVGELKPHL